MKATLIHQFKQAYRRRRIEGVIWKVPNPFRRPGTVTNTG
jgi:hypothetical protein